MRSPPYEDLTFQVEEIIDTKTKISEIKNRNKSVMFEELYEDCLSYLKIKRLSKAFSTKSDYRMARNIIVTEYMNWVFHFSVL